MKTSPSPPHAFPCKGDLVAGKYQVEEILGAGGMGVVVAARHVSLRQRVAVKFLLPRALVLPDAPARFLREARASAAIRNEHVTRVLDVGQLESGAPYMVMEYLSGRDLAYLLKERGRFPVVQAVDLVLQACEAIAEAHTLGIVHRDLKPANLFLTTRPEGAQLVKVLDFGLSKMEEDDASGVSLTNLDLVAGSPHYMSPEQIRSLKNVDARADLWALGVILYELVTGLRPFDGRTATAICASICADPYIPPRSRHGEVPEGLDAVLRACLEKDPARRVGSVAEFASALAPFASAGGARSIDAIDQIVAQSTPVSLSEADIEVLPTGVLSAPGPTPGPARAPSQALASSPVDARSGGADTAVASGGTKPPALQPPLVALGVSIALLALAGGLLGWVVSLRARPMHSAAGSTAAEPADRPQVTIAVAPAAPVVRPAPNVVEEHAPAPASAAPSASADAGAPGPRLPMGQPRAPKRLPLQPGPVRGGGANPLDRLD